jgi:hypothetical protein
MVQPRKQALLKTKVQLKMLALQVKQVLHY